MRTRLVVILVAFAWSNGLAAGTDSPNQWQSATPGYDWQFPRDLASHPDYKTEWWYFTGHLYSLEDPGAEPLGYQLTFFRSGIAPVDSLPHPSAWEPNDLIMAHAAISDPATEEHIFSEVLWRTTPFLGGFGQPGEEVLAWCQAPAGTNAQWKLTWKEGAFHLSVQDDSRDLRFELTCVPTQPRVFHGDQGFSPKTSDGGNGSLYFSQTRLKTTGFVERAGQRCKVTGSSWLDREIFTSTLAENQKGWDWAALGLDDGRDLMLYRMRDQEGECSFAQGTMINPSGESWPMAADQWQWEPLSYWTSKETGAQYPIRWKLTVPGENLELLIRAVIPHQENVSGRTGIHYWEGAVTVHSWNDQERIVGRGFVELTGYGEGSRPPI